MLNAKRWPCAALSISWAARVSAPLIAAGLLAGCSELPSAEDFGFGGAPVAFSGHVPKGGGHYSLGEPYRVAGKTYVPRDNPSYSAVGEASWYGRDFHGHKTANGEVYDMSGFTAAHPTLPLPCYVRVTNLANGRSMVVRVNDRGPFTRGRVIDVSSSVAELLDFKRAGTTRVQVKYVGPADVDGNDRRMLLASYQGPGARGTPEGSDKRPGVILASAPAARSRPAIDFGIADPGPDNGSDDALAPFVLRAGFASSYAAPNPLTPAQSAAAELAAGAADAPARPVPAIIQLGSFSDPDNADRTQRMFERYGKVVVVDRLSNSGALRSVRVVIEDPAIRPETVIAAAEAAGLTGAYLVKR